jgi:hypothetical protein
MSTTVNTSDNTVTISESNNSVSVTDNNTGTLVNVSGIDISTVTVATPGPKGDKGDTPSTIDASSIIQPFTNVTASANISASGDFEGNSYQIQGKSGITYNSSNTRIIYGQNNQNSRLRGKTITLGDSATQHVTASGNISSSGTIRGNSYFSDTSYAIGATEVLKYEGGNIKLPGSTVIEGHLDIQGGHHITASADISASGNIYGGIYYSYGKGLGVYSSVGNQIALSTGNVVTRINGTNIQLDSPVTASNEISASGKIYSDNHESIPLSFQASGDGTNWYGPNKQGPYYYVYNYNYGNDSAVTTLAQEYAGAGIIVPYKSTLVGFRSIVSHITQASTVRIALYKAAGDAGTFNDTDDAADDLTISSAVAQLSATPGAAENPMTINVTNGTTTLDSGDIIYPRIKTGGAGGAYVSMQILLKRRK